MAWFQGALKARSRRARTQRCDPRGVLGGTSSIQNNVAVYGTGDHAMILHGFGCDQNMWRFVARALEKDFMTVSFDHAGAVGSHPSAYHRAK